MSNNLTPERPVPHGNAYTLDMRWKYIRAHLDDCIAHCRPAKCGELARTYGGREITKADIQEELSKRSELGGSAK